MKYKKLLTVALPAILLAVGCNPTTQTTTFKFTKLDIGETYNTKSLLLGNISNSTDSSDAKSKRLVKLDLNKKTSNDDVTTETADEVDYTVETTTGTTTTEASTNAVEISSLVRLSKRWAAVEATYSSKSYALIVDLKTGSCYNFPDANLFPNVKKSELSYLSHRVIQNGYRIFYYLHADSNNIRKLYKLNLVDIENGQTPTVECVTPNETKTIASFALIRQYEDIVYSTYDGTITGEEEELDLTKFEYWYKPEGEESMSITLASTLTPAEDYLIMPLLFNGVDGCTYTYLQHKKSSDNDKTTYEYLVASIVYTEASEDNPATAIVNKISDTSFTKMPSKILKFKSESTDSQVVSFGKGTVETIKGASKIIQSIFKKTRDKLNGHHPGSRPQPSVETHIIKEESVKEDETTSFKELLDAFEGTNYLYYFGTDSKGSRHFKKIKYNSTTSAYEIVSDLLTSYFSTLTVDVEEIAEDSEEQIITVVTEDDNVTVIDTDTGTEGNEVLVVDENGHTTDVTADEVIDTSSAADQSELDD